MTTSQEQLIDELSQAEIGRYWLGYFQEGYRASLQQGLLEMFEWLKASTAFTRTDLARKIGRRPEQVTRWLSAPSNLESDTISDMALGMGFVPKTHFVPVAEEVGILHGSPPTHWLAPMELTEEMRRAQRDRGDIGDNGGHEPASAEDQWRAARDMYLTGHAEQGLWVLK